MNTAKYVNFMAGLRAKNKLSAFVIVVLVIAVLWLTVSLASMSRQQTVTIIPMGLSETVTVGAETASKEYLLAMGSYVAYLFMNFDAVTVVSQYEILSTLTAAVVRTQTYKLAEDYHKSNVSSRILIKNVDVTDQEVVVTGMRSKYILDKIVEEKPFMLGIKYKIKYGKFRIEELRL